MPLEYEVVFKIFPLESCLVTKSLVHLAFLFNNGLTLGHIPYSLQSIVTKVICA